MQQPKPFFCKFTKSWYVQIGKQQINLGRDKKVAFEKYHQLMSNQGSQLPSISGVAELLDEHLEWLLRHRSKGTYEKARDYLSDFATFVGRRQRIADLKPLQVIRWYESKSDWNETTAWDAVSTVQRAFNWAVKRGLIPQSPVARLEGKPQRKRREVVLTPQSWTELRSKVTDAEFGDLLDFLWLTGCRPLEARTLCAHHLDLSNAIVLFPPSEAKGKRNERVIFLPDDSLTICQRLVAQYPEGPIFRNTRGKPWTKDSMNCRFRRLKKVLGFDVCAYALRHSFATEGLKSGCDSLTLAQLMGHSDTSMLAKHYAHLARNPAYLREQARRLQRARKGE